MVLFNMHLRWLKASSKKNRLQTAGFTLLELLVAMIVAGIVVSGLLYIVVELLQIDRREAVLDRTQRDMQRALNYISDDVREAVYIYNDPSTVSANLSDIASSGNPILAFWRPDPVDTTQFDCTNPTIAADSDLLKECEGLEVRQSTYSLVLYLQKEDNSSVWLGNSRIIRYELDKYSNLSDLTKTTGYNDPAGVNTNFANWTPTGTTTAGVKSVLVDFVDSPTREAANPFDKAPLNDTVPGTSTASPCLSLGAAYNIAPSTATTTTNTSFFSCIRDPNPAVAGAEGNGNQDIYLFLRGNIEGAKGSVRAMSEDSALPMLETRVMMRGVINKNPGS